MEQRLEQPSPVPLIGVKLVIGLFFTALGLVLTLDNLDVIDAHQYLRYWPVVLIAVGLVKIGDAMTRGLAIAAIVLGTVLLALKLSLIRFSIFDLWPLLLIAAGIIVVAQAFGYRPGSIEGGWSAILVNRKISVDSRDFTGGRAVAILGGCQMDLTKADIEHSPAIIELLVIMGGIEMVVPDSWEVLGEAVPFMGGVDIKTRSKRTGRQLIVRGFVMWGGVDVRTAAEVTA